ncbi:hypothetical protein [Kangiella shandongensis]|uniref:hypothetical protein n=1 Tax=Kangiella shandongensis TaxID=2763258 RepID=UPI001CBD33E8|nr:hypothetical protein [Kangiella shandongensis]
MPWNNKCIWGTPEGFTDAAALGAVNDADFSQSIFVVTHNNKGTRSAYTYYDFGGYRLCVVAHIHIKNGKFVAPGHSYICGWENWSMTTPDDVCRVIEGLHDEGTFPEDERYPHQLSSNC